MISIRPRLIGDCSVTATVTATLLYSLVDTASGVPGSVSYYNTAPPLSSNGGTLTEPRDTVNAVSLRAENGNIRWAIGVTPTGTVGTLITSGTRMWVHGDISQLKIIRVTADTTVEVGFYSAQRDESVNSNTDVVTLNSEPTIDIGNVQVEAADTTTSGTVSATNGAGGTQIVAANTLRAVCQFQNQGAVDVYYGTGTVTTSYDRIVPSGTAAWVSKEALKVLSSGAACNISFTDYSNS